MAKKIAPLLPSAEELLHQFGDRLRLARQRRRLAAKQVAERAGMSPMTLRSLERGGSGVTMGAYLAVMQVLGIENDLGLLGKADPQGRELQDARLSAASKRVAVTQVHRMMEGPPQEQPCRDFASWGMNRADCVVSVGGGMVLDLSVSQLSTLMPLHYHHDVRP